MILPFQSLIEESRQVEPGPAFPAPVRAEIENAHENVEKPAF
jgi:hypothetical protein